MSPIVEEPEPKHPWGANLHTTHSGYSWLPGHPPQAVPCAAEPNVAAPQTEEPGAYAYPAVPQENGNDAAVFVVRGVGEEAAVGTSIAREMQRMFALFQDRQRKYGPGNIAAFGDYGVLVRCHDKLARLKRHYVEGVGDMPDESVEDAWSDLAVYATIALVCRRGAWPGWEVK